MVLSDELLSRVTANSAKAAIGMDNPAMPISHGKQRVLVDYQA